MSFESEKLEIVRIEIEKFSVEISSSSDKILFRKQVADIGFYRGKHLAKVSFHLETEGLCIGDFKLSVIFKVKNLHDLTVYDQEKEEISNIDEDLSNHLYAIAYSTIRGIIYTKTLGTEIDGLILPIVSPQIFPALE